GTAPPNARGGRQALLRGQSRETAASPATCRRACGPSWPRPIAAASSRTCVPRSPASPASGFAEPPSAETEHRSPGQAGCHAPALGCSRLPSSLHPDEVDGQATGRRNASLVELDLLADGFEVERRHGLAED